MSVETRWATSLPEWAELIKELVRDPAKCHCPACGDDGQLHASHGLAGGGNGPYVICLRCRHVLIKYRAPDGGA